MKLLTHVLMLAVVCVCRFSPDVEGPKAFRQERN